MAVTGDAEWFHETYPATTRETIVHFLAFDENYANSILSCVVQARENARSIREIISSEMWEELNTLYLNVRQASRQEGRGTDPFAFCKSVLQSCYLFTGLFYSTMNRGEAWHFGRAGMLLERADKTSRILDVKYFILLPDPALVGSAYDNTQWAALLKSVSGLEMYRKIYRRISPRDVAEFLLLEKDFPRSLVHCLQNAEESIRLLGGPLKTISRLKTELETSTIDDVLQTGLHEYLDGLQTRMNQVDSDLFQVFFEIKRGSALEGTLGHHRQSQS